MSEEKTATVTKPERRAAMPAKAPKKISQGTVKGKIAAIQQAIVDIDSGRRAMQQKVNKQMKETQEATANMQSGALAMQSGARAIQSKFLKHAKENRAFVKAFYG